MDWKSDWQTVGEVVRWRSQRLDKHEAQVNIELQLRQMQRKYSQALHYYHTGELNNLGKTGDSNSELLRLYATF